MSDKRDDGEELLNLLKSQSRDAYAWSHAIKGAFFEHYDQNIDQEYLHSCLANAMMSIHDSIFNNEIKRTINFEESKTSYGNGYGDGKGYGDGYGY